MEALVVIGIIANFAGIVSLAIQLAELLEKAIDNARTADEKVQHIAAELRKLARGLTALQTLLDEDLKASGDRLFTDEDCRNIHRIVQQCDTIFHQIVISFAKMGRVALPDAVDESGGTAVIPHNTLTFKFSMLGRLMWHFKSREILQSVADLNELKASLMLIITKAEESGQNRRREKEMGRAAWKKWKWVVSLRQRWKSSALRHHHQSTTYLEEAKQQLCIDAAPAKDLSLWRHENRSHHLYLEGLVASSDE